MCRIAGVFNFNNNLSEDDWNNLLKSSSLLEKAGPDNCGTYRNGNVALLHRRLSIIDTSAKGNQPFYSNDKRYVLIFNGMIFNYKQLYNQHLAPLGVKLESESDTEVFLHLFLHFNVQCLNWLSVFFAFAFLDTHTSTMHLCRDRMGKKPLVYYKDDDQLIFSSELKSILAFPIKKEINKTALHAYFRLNYVPSNTAILHNISKVQPGHYIKVTKLTTTDVQYYKTEITESLYNQYSYPEAQQKLKQLLQDSVHERMIADVPLGAFLSGGIDSSLVVALAAQYTNKLHTFSIGYKDFPLFDETHYALSVAKKYQTEHQVFKLSNTDFVEEIDNVLDAIDEPFADSSAIPQYILSKRTKAFAKVALSGDGGDEVFAGYNKHKGEWIYRNNQLLVWAMANTNVILKYLPKGKGSKMGELLRKAYKFSNAAALPADQRYLQWCSISTGVKATELFNASYINQATLSDDILKPYVAHFNAKDFNEVLLADINLVLPSDMLFKVDMMSMANGLEVRSPLLDHKVVDFAFSLPQDYKINKQLKKRILQDTFRDMLPPELYNRPKQGFEIPLVDWFKNEFYSKIFDDLLSESFIKEQGIFNYSRILELKNQLFSTNTDNIQFNIWALVVFQSWYRKYLM